MSTDRVKILSSTDAQRLTREINVLMNKEDAQWQLSGDLIVTPIQCTVMLDKRLVK